MLNAFTVFSLFITNINLELEVERYKIKSNFDGFSFKDQMSLE